MALTLLLTLFCPGVQGQPKDVYVEGNGFTIYTDLGLGFHSKEDTMILTIEVLTGTWGGENCRLGVNERGGELYWESNETCTIQITNYHDRPVRLYYEGFTLSYLVSGYSWNGTFPNDGTGCLLHWSFMLPSPVEENWGLFLGILGLALLIIGLLLMAYLVKTYPLFSFSREILFDKMSFAVAISLIIIGFGFIMMWLMS